MIGTREAQPIGQVMPQLLHADHRSASPSRCDFDRYADRADDPQVLRQITDEIMFELRELSGQEYVNQYAKRKDTDDAMAAEPAKVA